jgi:hypothetical protein
MKVGLVGWYGHGNAGDERILAVLKRIFAGHDLVWTDRPGLHYLREQDLVIIGGGGLVVRNMPGWAEAIRSWPGRVGTLGLSVEADNHEVISALRERCAFLHVRDEESRARLGNDPKVVVGPDLTFWDPLEPIEPGHGCALNLRPWPYWKAEFGGRLDKWMTRMDARHGWIRSAYPGPRWRPDQAAASVRARFGPPLGWSMYTEPGFPSDTDELAKVDLPPDPEALDRAAFVVSMRLHGLIFATQRGRPFVSLSYQPKNIAYCRSVGMEHASIDLYDLSALGPALERMPIDGDETRARLRDATSAARRLIRDQVQTLVG